MNELVLKKAQSEELGLKELNVDCQECVYGTDGGRGTICCCYYGSEECEPFGQCEQFTTKESF